MDVLQCVSISKAEDAPLLERFYNELMIPNFPLKEVNTQQAHGTAAQHAQPRIHIPRPLSLPRAPWSDVRSA